MEEKIKRRYIIGDEWLFYKVYCGPNIADFIISEVLYPLTKNLLKEGIIDKWFYIRYSDPEYHLRIRFHLGNLDHLQTLIVNFNKNVKRLLDEDMIWKLQTDMYQREIERYGRNTMELSENIFSFESMMIMNFIKENNDSEKESLRWLFALKAVSVHLDNFNYSLDEKINLLKKLKIGFRSEFDNSRFLGKQLSQKYRTNKEKIELFLGDDFSKKHPRFNDILLDYSKKVAPFVSEIITKEINKTLTLSFDDLNASYIHMMLNRLFKSKNRLQEMVCYDFLFRYYESYRARKVSKSIKK